MITGSKGQGLPINTIILIAIGLLILVLFITFVLNGFKGIGGSTNPNAQAQQAFASNCQTACSESAASNNPAQWCSYPNDTIGGTLFSCGNVPGGTTSCRLDNGTTFYWGSSGSPSCFSVLNP
ncbi:MAG: hypothetical protein M1433_00470 [Candidatus Parvarchaeota archaeon]|nr:hypothetical protein [Candidatus Parvarchaeota archaeon]